MITLEFAPPTKFVETDSVMLETEPPDAVP
jgi:hypothetical protein